MNDSPEKTCILVTGLPRSGTSSVSHLLDHLGVYFGDSAHFLDTSVHKHNPVFYELQWINDLNDRVIAALGSSYFADFFPIESDFDSDRMRALETEAVELFRSEFGDRPLVGVKDPRICFTLPFWRRLLDRLGYAAKLLLTLRNQSATIKSNSLMRDDRPVQWRRFYARHLLAFNYFSHNLRPCRVDFDELMADPQPVATAVAKCLGLPIPDPSNATRHFSPSHYHHRPADDSDSIPWIDAVDADLRAGRLEPERYLLFRQIALLYAGDMGAAQTEAEKRIAEVTGPKDAHISKLESMIHESAGEVRKAVNLERADAEARLAAKETHIAKLEAMIHESTEVQKAVVTAERADADQRVALKDQHIAKLETALRNIGDETARGYELLRTSKDEHIAKLEKMIRDSAGRILTLEQMIHDREAETGAHRPATVET
jgi:hypothetical protein